MTANVEPWALDALQQARVGRLATVSSSGAVGLVPICFVVVDAWIGSAVDHKPKRSGRLRRLADIEAPGAATVLVDHYEDDWSRLWWVRVRGRAVVHWERDVEALAVLDALRAKYAQYRKRPPEGAVYRIALDEVRSWRPTADSDEISPARRR